MQEAQTPSKPERLGRLALGAALVLPPLFFLPSAKDAFRLPKLMLSELLVLVSVLGLAWALRRVDRLAPKTWWRIPVVAALAPLVVVAGLSLLTSEHGHHVRSAWISLAIGCLGLTAWSLTLSGRTLRRFLDLLLVPALLLALLGVLQFHDLFRPFQFAGGEEGRRFGITSLAGNAGDLAAYLVLPCLIAQAGWLGRRRHVWAWGLAAVALVYAIAVTQTLAALVALAVASAVLWLGGLSRRRIVAGIGLLVVGATLVAVLVVPRVPRLENKWRDVREGRVNALLTGRLDGWRTAAWMMRQSPIVGVGHGAYRAEFAVAKLALLDDEVPFFRNADQPTFANAHNEPLEVAAESGLLGLAALAWCLWAVIAAVRRLPSRRSFGVGTDPPSDARGQPKHPGRGKGKKARPAASKGKLLALGDDPERRLAVAGLAALAVLSMAHFPFRIALTAYPALLLLAWIWRRSREVEVVEVRR